MVNQRNTGGKEEQTEPQGYYKHYVGGLTPFIFLSNREKKQAEYQHRYARWYRKVGGWIWRSRRVPGACLRRYATVVIMFATVVYAVYAGLQWSTMQQQLEMSERPWVSGDFTITSPLVFDPAGEAHLSLRVALRNTGHSVATGIQVRAQMFPVSLPRSFDEPIERQAEICEAMRRE